MRDWQRQLEDVKRKMGQQSPEDRKTMMAEQSRVRRELMTRTRQGSEIAAHARETADCQKDLAGSRGKD